jgi:hypothetical protein
MKEWGKFFKYIDIIIDWFSSVLFMKAVTKKLDFYKVNYQYLSGEIFVI